MRKGSAALRLVLSALMLGVPIVASSATPASAGGPPVGFTSSLVLANLEAGEGSNPTAFAYAPDGRIFIARKAGIIDVYDGGVQNVFLDIQDEVNSFQSRGLLGLALDPDYANTKRVFALFTQELDTENPDQNVPAGGEIISVAEQAENPDAADLSTRVTLLSGYPSTSREHSVGALRFDGSGNLLATLGDATEPGVDDGQALHALELDDLRGKLVRIDRTTGEGVPDNPYYDSLDPSSVRSRIYARGLRNAFRFTVDPDDGTVYVGNVGWNTWEMLNAFPATTANPDKDRNAGWPCYEGGDGVALPAPLFQYAPVSQATCAALYPPELGGTGIGVLDPLYGYRHDDPGGENGSSITAGPKYTGTSNYPPEYIGQLFVGDYARDRFQIVDPTTGDATDFGTPGDWGNPVDIQIAPDGNVAYLGIRTAELREIVYTGTNHVPVAVASADVQTSETAPLEVSFTGHDSSDLDPGDTLTYDWDFADGSAHETTADAVHTFEAIGSYDVTLTVSDGQPGGTVSTDLWIDVGNTPPSVALDAPTPEFRYSIGDPIDITLSASDPEDGPLIDTSIFTQVRLIHLGHFHPILDFYGATASFVTEDHDSDDTYYEVISTATDAYGRSSTTTTNILPNKETVTLTSNPSGATISIDGSQHTTPYSWSSIVGGNHELDAPADVFTGGAPYAFDEWVQGTLTDANQFFTFTTPPGGTALITNYSPTTPGLSISDAGVVEGDTGTRTVTLNVSLTTVPTDTVTVDYATDDGSGVHHAFAGSDYDAQSGTLTFAPGVSTRTIDVDVIGDTDVEGTEHFSVLLLNANGAQIVGGPARANIIDDDPGSGLRVSVGDVKVLETNGGRPTASVTVTLSDPSPGGVSVDYSMVNGTAHAPSDFVAKSGKIKFGRGKTTRAIAIAIKGDGTFEPTESFTFNLTNPVGATIDRASGTVKIANDDGGPALSVSDTSMVEGNSGTTFIKFSLALSTPAPQPVAVTYTFTHTTTNGGDVQLKSGVVSIPVGTISQSFQLKAFADTTPEADETFAVTLSNPINAALADPTGVGTIINDDPSDDPQVSIGDVAMNEGNAGKRMMRFIVTLSSPSIDPVTVHYSTGAGTASPGHDYTAHSGNLTIPAGQTSGLVIIQIKGNAVAADVKTFEVTLSDPSEGVTLGRAVGTGTIFNDD